MFINSAKGKAALNELSAFWRRHRARIIYYAAVAVVLAAVAIAAEGYRDRKTEAEQAHMDPANQIVQTAHVGLESVTVQDDAFAPQLADGAAVLRGYSAAPVLNAALRQWEVHTGTDIRFADGKIAALCGGTVDAVAQDTAYGCAVEVRTGERLIRYMGVEAPTVCVGDTIDVGDPIGGQSDRVRSEAHLGAHAHIEAYDGVECIDLEGYICADESESGD